jgi:Kdo2-lipid IVA lauroyltransferase/acyltransferase
VAEPSTMDPALRDVKSLTEWYTGVLETIIRRAPEQYWWVHRRWRDRGEMNVLAAKKRRRNAA